MLGLVTLTGLAATPAHAAGGNTNGTIGGTYPTVGAGVVVAGFCLATATADAGYVVAATSVYCTVNGFRSPTVTSPGPVAVTPSATTASLPLEICVSTQAVFVTPLGVIVTSPWKTQCYHPA